MVRLIMGNPLIMQSMARLVLDAVAYAPVTVVINQRPDGVHLTDDERGSRGNGIAEADIQLHRNSSEPSLIRLRCTMPSREHPNRSLQASRPGDQGGISTTGNCEVECCPF